jgi:hypothetical protein
MVAFYKTVVMVNFQKSYIEQIEINIKQVDLGHL